MARVTATNVTVTICKPEKIHKIRLQLYCVSHCHGNPGPVVRPVVSLNLNTTVTSSTTTSTQASSSTTTDRSRAARGRERNLGPPLAGFQVIFKIYAEPDSECDALRAGSESVLRQPTSLDFKVHAQVPSTA
eukprot:3033774-Rhodomonas_salina.1